MVTAKQTGIAEMNAQAATQEFLEAVFLVLCNLRLYTSTHNKQASLINLGVWGYKWTTLFWGL